jgi:hypothetical protein
MEEKECLGEYKKESNKCRSCKDNDACRWKKLFGKNKSSRNIKIIQNFTKSAIPQLKEQM